MWTKLGTVEEVCVAQAPVIAARHNICPGSGQRLGRRCVRTLIDRHLCQARACIEGMGAKTVIMASAMHRKGVRGKMYVKDYNDRVDKFNRGMKRVICRWDVPMHANLDIWWF